MISASVPESEAVVKLLIAKDADVNLKSKTRCRHFKNPRSKADTINRCQWTGRTSATGFRNAPLTSLGSKTALHFVASKKNLDIARILIDNSASTRFRDRRGQYPIHRAAAAGSVPMVTLLLKNRSPLNPTDNEGYTPLHHAVAEGHGTQAMLT